MEDVPAEDIGGRHLYHFWFTLQIMACAAQNLSLCLFLPRYLAVILLFSAMACAPCGLVLQHRGLHQRDITAENDRATGPCVTQSTVKQEVDAPLVLYRIEDDPLNVGVWCHYFAVGGERNGGQLFHQEVFAAAGSVARFLQVGKNCVRIVL
eukprot:TRINITY_DN12988_c0_g1_i1.p1 TRINITY_DN12988_c0_g1~~TRINITY_DN12988_c0_g1_i1.p1  ORF type:complete len:152 (-),score=18.84 TRINITY_DN12988_c0_g1_i1:317-772(-)